MARYNKTATFLELLTWKEQAFAKKGIKIENQGKTLLLDKTCYPKVMCVVLKLYSSFFLSPKELSDDEIPLEDIIQHSEDSIQAIKKTPARSPLKFTKGRYGKRKIRCKKCEGCTSEDCGVCNFCLYVNFGHPLPLFIGRWAPGFFLLLKTAFGLLRSINLSLNEYASIQICVEGYMYFYSVCHGSIFPQPIVLSYSAIFTCYSCLINKTFSCF